MLKILHAADLHLDSPFSGLSPEAAARRRGEQRLLLSDLSSLAQREQVDLVLLSGDLLDAGHVYRETAAALARCLGEMDCPVFIAPGNHDPYTSDSPYATLSWPENVHIFTGDVEKYVLEEKNCVVYGCAFTSAYKETSPLESFLVTEGRSTVKLMCMHGDLSPNSPYCPITGHQIAASGLTYLALGHIHRRSGLCRAGSTFYAYPGCPQGRGFDETGEKGALILTVAPGAVEERFVPLCRHRYERVELDVTGKDPLSALAAALPADPMTCACRITLTGEHEGVDLPALHAALAPRFESLTILDKTTLPRDIWARREDEDLTGLMLRALYARCQSEPDNEAYRLAARFAAAALTGGEDPAP